MERRGDSGPGSAPGRVLPSAAPWSLFPPLNADFPQGSVEACPCFSFLSSDLCCYLPALTSVFGVQTATPSHHLGIYSPHPSTPCLHSLSASLPSPSLLSLQVPALLPPPLTALLSKASHSLVCLLCIFLHVSPLPGLQQPGLSFSFPGASPSTWLHSRHSGTVGCVNGETKDLWIHCQKWLSALIQGQC